MEGSRVTGITLPVLGELVPGGLEYGRTYLVEFESQSLWYETSLTITSHAVRNGMKAEYHAFLHPPSEVREALQRMGIDVRNLEEGGFLRILDTYSVTTGLSTPEKPRHGPDPYQSRSVSMMNWSAEIERQIREGFPEDHKRWLHIDDAASILNQYDEEKNVLETWRTRWIPYTRARDLVDIPSVLAETSSPAFYREFESFSDAIFEFRSHEEGGRIENYVRLRVLRGRACDTSWRRLKLTEKGEVRLGHERERLRELGIRGWIKGEK